MNHPAAPAQGSHLDDTWQKAAVVGSLWAASEVVLGSFLHNLHIPFRGLFLTSIGVILLVASQHRWKNRGLIWRAGLICAVMKSVSPSAVIFGPMIAILSEALLIELSLRVAGRNLVGYMAGGFLAVSWSFIQKIANWVIIYGFNIVELYTSMVGYAGKQFGLQFASVWMPLVALWVLYLLFGALSAVAGVYVGRTSSYTAPAMMGLEGKKVLETRSRSGVSYPAWSIPWLMFSVTALVVVLLLMNLTGATWWTGAGTLLMTTWIVRYRQVLRPLRKPAFWVLFVIITLLSSVVFAGVQPGKLTVWDGLLVGLEMNFRAALVVIGFSVIGKELANPAIKDFFLRRSFRQFPMSLEAAFSTLPFIIGHLPPGRELARNPVAGLRQVISQTEFWLTRIQLGLKGKSNVILVTGNRGDGKSTFMKALAGLCLARGILPGGILAPAVVTGGERRGYDLVPAAGGAPVRLADTETAPGRPVVGRFSFHSEGIERGLRLLAPENNRVARVVFIDEVGAWELDGQGWAGRLNDLILQTDLPLVIAINRKYTEQVIAGWQFRDPVVIDVAGDSPERVFEQIILPLAGLPERSPAARQA